MATVEGEAEKRQTVSNPNPPPPPAEHQFSKEKQPERNGRTPTKWLRDRLNRAARSGEGTQRDAIYEHIYEIATSWDVIVVGMDKDDKPIKVASGRDAVNAAKLLFEYDMGKPTSSVEVSNPDGSFGAHSKTTAELRQAIAALLGLKDPASQVAESDGPGKPG